MTTEMTKELSEKKTTDMTTALEKEILSYCSRNGGYLASDLSASVLITSLYSRLEEDTHLYFCSEYSNLYPILNKLYPKENAESCPLAYACGKILLRDRHSSAEKICIFLDRKDLTYDNVQILKQIVASGKQLTLIIHEYRERRQRINPVKKGISALGNTPAYNNLKSGIKRSLTPLKYGKQIVHSIHTTKTAIKKAVWNEGVFKILDIDYYGPYDGNDPEEVLQSLQNLSQPEHPCVLHFLCEERVLPAKYNDLIQNGYTEPFDLNTGKRKIEESTDFLHSATILKNRIDMLMEKDPSILFVNRTGSERFRSLSAGHPQQYEEFDLTHEDLLKLAIGITNKENTLILSSDAKDLLSDIDILNDLADRISGRFLLCALYKEDVDLSALSALKGYLVCIAKDAGEIEAMIDRYHEYEDPLILICPDQYFHIDKNEENLSEFSGILKYPVNKENGRRAAITDGTDFDVVKKAIAENDADIDLYCIRSLSPFPKEEFDQILDGYDRIHVYHSCIEQLLRDQANIHRKGSVVQYLGKDEIHVLFEELS